MTIQALEKAIENLEYKVSKLEFEVYEQRRTIGQLIMEKADRKTEPQTCDTCKWGEWYRKGYDITMMSDECGGCCSWNNKWKPKDEPQTVISYTSGSNSYGEQIQTDQTDCSWQKGE